MLAKKPPEVLESVVLYALLTALTALSLDIVLPAYTAIGDAFGLAGSADLQQSVLSFVGGMLIGELVSGAFADHIGRRKALALCVLVFLAGTIICWLSENHLELLFGRALQGVGAAGQKICTRTMIRDRYVGAAMARIMSYVLTAFIALPFIAPAIGALLTDELGWRSIFLFLALYGVITFAWYWLRHPETLANTGNLPSGHNFVQVLVVFCRHKQSLRLTVVAGLLFGVHLGFISLSPLIFAQLYDITDQFPAFFGSVVSAFGIALLANAKLVERHGMVSMISAGIVVAGGAQVIFFALVAGSFEVPFLLFFAYLFLLLFSLGLIFGNLTALIMQPLGHVAGRGGAISSALSSAIALGVSAGMGSLFNGNLMQFVAPVACVSALAYGLFFTSVRAP